MQSKRQMISQEELFVPQISEKGLISWKYTFLCAHFFLNQQLIEKHTKCMKSQFSEKQMQMVVTQANKRKATNTPPLDPLVTREMQIRNTLRDLSLNTIL